MDHARSHSFLKKITKELYNNYIAYLSENYDNITYKTTVQARGMLGASARARTNNPPEIYFDMDLLKVIEIKLPTVGNTINITFGEVYY